MGQFGSILGLRQVDLAHMSYKYEQVVQEIQSMFSLDQVTLGLCRNYILFWVFGGRLNVVPN